MEKVGAYKIIYDRPLIVEYYYGLITAEDLIYLKNVIRKEPDYNLYFNTVLDLRDCDLQINSEGLATIVDFFESSFEKTGIRKVAYLTSKPNEVVRATLYSILLGRSELNFNPNIFSTIEAVIGFFGEEIITEKELIEIIDELKTKPDNVYTKQAYKDFVLEMEFKPESTINSGVFIRCKNYDINASDCYEINIWD